ncbi:MULTISPECIES: hypothetical protein [Nocardioides]|jgi:hypothetical protein|uniref:hypothetical protein n=1 Tax=Nocardioides TaxID=1839 RepID=UPI0003305224|nr:MULTISPECIES: hypothetical protein [Nocardioides]EON22969.1 hypothetical protein CF8_3109 [Nocardioides sp. CF8]
MSNYPYPQSSHEADTSGRHPVSVGHLVMGVAFLGLATIWLLFQSDTIGNDDLRWFLPLPWLAAGLAGLLAVALTGRRAKPDVDGGYAEAPVYAEPEPMWSEPDATGAGDEQV